MAGRTDNQAASRPGKRDLPCRRELGQLLLPKFGTDSEGAHLFTESCYQLHYFVKHVQRL